MRRLSLKYLILTVGAAIAASAALFLVLVPGRPPRPNIVLVSIDTLRADRLGCYGGPAGISPNIDAFSRDSVRFMHVISQAPSTASAHMSLFTGLLPPIHRVTNKMTDIETWRKMGMGLAPSIPTLAQYLQENGYRTAGFHGGGNVSALLGFDRGFDVYQKTPWETLCHDPAPLNRVGRWLKGKNAGRKPFFLFVHHYICHQPYLQSPPGFRRRFLSAPVPGLQEELERIAPQGLKTTSGFGAVRNKWWSLIDADNAAHRRHVRDLYDAGVAYADDVLGKILDNLKRRGLYDRSLVIVTSDHGEQFWEHGGTGHRGWLFIETLHVPLLVKFPGGKYGGRKIATPVGLFDLMPTVLDQLKVSPRMEMQARSLLPLVRKESFTVRPLVSFHEGLKTQRLELDDFAYSDQPSGAHPEWLFDRSRDPGERHNLAGSRSQTLLRMRALAARVMQAQRLLRSRIKTGAHGPRQVPADLKKQLEALGYL